MYVADYAFSSHDDREKHSNIQDRNKIVRNYIKHCHLQIFPTYRCYSDGFHVVYCGRAAEHPDISGEGRLQTRLTRLTFQRLNQ